MDLFISLILISMLIYILKFILCKLCKKIKIEATSEIDNDLKKVSSKLKKNIGLAIVYVLLLIAFIVVMIWFFNLGGDVNNKQELQVVLFIIIGSLIFGPIYNLFKTIPDISNVLVQNYGFTKKDEERNFFYKNETSGEKIFFNYYVNDTFDFDKKFTYKLSNRYILTEFKFYLNRKSNRKSTDINMEIREFIDKYSSNYIPQYLRIERCTYDANKNFLIISIKNSGLLYTLYNNKVIAKLLILSFKESEKIMNEIIKNYIDVERN